MREIKFRAWDKENNRMVNIPVGVYPNDPESTRQPPDHSISSDGIIVSTESNTMVLMQYTGLKDKNDKEIYEGDIVRIKIHPSHPKLFEVYFFEGAYCIRETNNLVGLLGNWRKGSTEILGNIYENPELLNV